MPLAFAVTIIVSLATPSRVPAGTARTMVRLHTPEDLAAGPLGRSPASRSAQRPRPLGDASRR